MTLVYGTRYADLSDLTMFGLIGNALVNVSQAAQHAALDAASALCDSYLRGQFTLPLLTWGYELTRATAIIAAYDLITTRGYNPGTILSANVDHSVRDRYLDVLAWLDKVRESRLTPSNITDSSTTGSSSGSDGSVNVDVSADLQWVTGSPRGWTSRGSNGGPW